MPLDMMVGEKDSTDFDKTAECQPLDMMEGEKDSTAFDKLLSVSRV